jgi:hypothetical protein
MTEENKDKVEQFLKLLNIDTDIVEAENIKEEQPKEKEEWPKYNDKYYAIISCGIDDFYWKNDMYYDMFVKSIGNCFKSEEEAEFEVERLKVLAKMKKFAEPEDREWDGENQHWEICVDMLDKSIYYAPNQTGKCHCMYFESREKAEECVRTIGSVRIRKYYFRIKE